MTASVDDVVAFAHSLAGLTADPARPECRTRYLDVIARGETFERAADMATLSGCALTMRGVLREFITHPFLDSPYVTGHAMSDLVQIAHEAGAVRPRLDPQLGDVVIIGGGTDGGGPEHTFMVTSINVDPDPRTPAEAREVLTVIEGGQRDAGRFACIIQRDHEIDDHSGLDHAPGSAPRKVRFVLDTGAILERFGR